MVGQSLRRGDDQRFRAAVSRVRGVDAFEELAFEHHRVEMGQKLHALILAGRTGAAGGEAGMRRRGSLARYAGGVNDCLAIV